MLKNKIILPAVVASLALLAGCATGTNTASTESVDQRIELTDQQVKAIKAGVRDALVDPESARFGNMVAGAKNDGSIYVCGMVNAKNRMGGYSGATPFIGMILSNGQFAPVSLDPSESGRYATNQRCDTLGLSVY
ncbi:hypothetical protein [Halofilum ochraceum]|uniref:hypothetical protein n=1 Tax=Halofilum ochraceum TaxID=1611323 RepID=UPI001113064A|nr:hypothetical protein [Halofilum ochraceum]